MKHSFAALCWAVMAAGLILSCAKKPKPTFPDPVPEKVNGRGFDTTMADGDRGRGHSLEDAGFAKSHVSGIEYAPIYFALDGVTPLPQSRHVLQSMVEEMPGYKSCRIEGHTCPLGTETYNMALGHARAEAVLQYLRAANVHTGFQVISYGEEHLVAFEESKYALNRRVMVECEK